MSEDSSNPVIASGEDRQLGIIQMLLHDMPAWQKSILSFFLIVPIALALSGLILQVNVGSIIQALVSEQLAKNREETVGTITDSLQQSTASLSEQIASVQREALSSSNRLDRLEERTSEMINVSMSRIDKLEVKTDELTKSINDIKIYVCDTDQKGRGDCIFLR